MELKDTVKGMMSDDCKERMAAEYHQTKIRYEKLKKLNTRIFNEDGHGVDFIFRYCNAQMAVVEGVPIEEMLNRSFYKVFSNGDKKWLVAYADVALNGTKHTLRDYSPEINKNLIIHCYQPEPGYCACVLQVTEQ